MVVGKDLGYILKVVKQWLSALSLNNALPQSNWRFNLEINSCKTKGILFSYSYGKGRRLKEEMILEMRNRDIDYVDIPRS